MNGMKSKTATIAFISIIAYVIVAGLTAVALSGVVTNTIEFIRSFRLAI